MKISNPTTNLVNQAYTNSTAQQGQTAGNAKADKNKDANPSSSVDFSNKTKDLQKISQAIEVEPAVMSEKVAQLKKEISENTYNVDADKIADKMVGSFLDKVI